MSIIKCNYKQWSRFGQSNFPYKMGFLSLNKAVINYPPRCSYHLLYYHLNTKIVKVWYSDNSKFKWSVFGSPHLLNTHNGNFFCRARSWERLKTPVEHRWAVQAGAWHVPDGCDCCLSGEHWRKSQTERKEEAKS